CPYGKVSLCFGWYRQFKYSSQLQHSQNDLKSHPMRSKLLSLHLILTILTTHMEIFTNPSVVLHSYAESAGAVISIPFIAAVKQYLCLALSRNAISSIPQIFSICVDIFSVVVSGLRMLLKVSHLIE